MNRPMLLACSLAATARAFASDFIPMPDLPGGTFLSRANAVANGWVVGMSSGVNGNEAVRWNPYQNIFAGLGDLQGAPFASEAFACSFDAGIVFGYGTNALGNQEAFRWTVGAGMAPLGFLDGGSASRAYACSYDGAIACGESVTQSGSQTITQGFRWTGNGMEPLGFLPGGAFSTARSISLDGGVIVGWALDANGVTRPFRWTAATGMVDISVGAFAGQARGVSFAGDAVVGVNQSTGQAFLWKLSGTNPGYTELPALPGATSSVAQACTSPDDRVVGSSGGRACTWTSSCGWAWSVRETVYAPVAGWTIASAQAADPAYTVGNGTNPAGQPQGWFAVDLGSGPQCCCGADFNCDGDVGTDADIEAFFACLAGTCPPPPCPYNADFNGDGDVGTDADIDAFIRVLVGSCC